MITPAPYAPSTPAGGAPGGPSAGQRNSPTRIGQARPSHLITTAGVGATVDLPSMSVIVRGLNAWNPERQEPIEEPRLLDTVQRVLGPQVRALRHTPWDPDDKDDPYTRTGVPVTPFPRWVRCPRCFRLGPLDPPGQFELVHRWGRRPDLAKYVHAHCLKQANVRVPSRRPCVPARFLVVCEDGHLDEFPYVEYVHATRTEGVCAGPQLTMSDAASTLGPRVIVRCVSCDHSRNLQEAAAVLPVREAAEADCARGEQPVVRGVGERTAPAPRADGRGPGSGALGRPGGAAFDGRGSDDHRWHARAA